jgi:Ferritin-like domain
MAEQDATRRELVHKGVAAGTAAAVAAVLTPLLRPAGALADPIGDPAVLQFALRAEQTIVYAYDLALASGVISAPSRRVLKLFLGQEHEHVDALSVSMLRLGDTVPGPPTDIATFEVLLRELHVKRTPAKLHTEREWVSFLVRLEGVLATVYHFVIEQLVDHRLIQTAAQMMANEGQHATMLCELTNPGKVALAVPRAFVGGAT